VADRRQLHGEFLDLMFWVFLRLSVEIGDGRERAPHLALLDF
jgi:hypothetical protein